MRNAFAPIANNPFTGLGWWWRSSAMEPGDGTGE